jgi:hypothetical protein
MIQYDLSIGSEELNALCKLVLCSSSSLRRQRPLKIMSVVFGVATLLLSLIYVTHNEVKSGCFLLACSICFFFLAIRGIYLIQASTVKRSMKKDHNELLELNRHYSIDSRGVRLTSQYGNSENPWSAFRCWGVQGHYVYLHRIDSGYLLIDRNRLSTEERDELFQLLSTLPREDRS